MWLATPLPHSNHFTSISHLDHCHGFLTLNFFHPWTSTVLHTASKLTILKPTPVHFTHVSTTHGLLTVVSALELAIPRPFLFLSAGSQLKKRDLPTCFVHFVPLLVTPFSISTFVFSLGVQITI